MLRGINVGGKSLIKMAELRLCLEEAELKEVTTYIQSGNVLFKSAETDTGKLANKIEKALAKAFDYKSWVLLKSSDQMQAITKAAPRGFGDKPAEYRYDVIFLQEPLTSAEAMQGIDLKDGVDEVAMGKDVLYLSRLTARATQSRLSRIVGTPMYQNMTIRNWNTTVKLADLLEV